MNEYFYGNVLPRLDRLEQENKKLELKFNCKPQIKIEIESTDTDKLIESMQKLCSNFGTANLSINATLKEAAANGV